MLKILKCKKLTNQNAQMIANEYVIVFFVVIALLGSMSTFFRRTIQARIRGTQKLMASTIEGRIYPAIGVVNSYANHIRSQYEPYYTESASDILRSEYTYKYNPSGNISKKIVNDIISSDSVTITAPPINAH